MKIAIWGFQASPCPAIFSPTQGPGWWKPSDAHGSHWGPARPLGPRPQSKCNCRAAWIFREEARWKWRKTCETSKMLLEEWLRWYRKDLWKRLWPRWVGPCVTRKSVDCEWHLAARLGKSHKSYGIRFPPLSNGKLVMSLWWIVIEIREYIYIHIYIQQHTIYIYRHTHVHSYIYSFSTCRRHFTKSIMTKHYWVSEISGKESKINTYRLG